MAGRDEQTGKYTTKYPREDFLSVLDSSDGPLGTGEIADEVGCAHDTAYKKLQKLEEEDIVQSRMLGNTRVWELV